VFVHTVKPGPVKVVDVFTNDTNVYVTFNSPKRGKSLQYNVSIDCAEDGSREVNCLVDVIHNGHVFYSTGSNPGMYLAVLF